MAQASRAERALPQAPTFPLAAVAALLAATMVAVILAFSTLDPFGLLRPAVDFPNVDPALRDAEARWELHRKLQAGDLDPQFEVQREWERMQRELSPFN